MLLIPNMVWGDEVFQATEQAHRLVYGTGLIPWEFQLGVRSWLLPGAIAGLMQLARLLGDGPAYYLPLISTAFALLATAPVVCCFLWCRQWFGLSGAVVGGLVVALAPELAYFGAHTLSEVVAGHLLVVALYLLDPGIRAPRSRLYAGGLLLGLVFVLRIQLAPAIALAALWGVRGTAAERMKTIATGALTVLALAGALDTLTLGYPGASIVRYVLYNVSYGVSATFGVDPWYYYLAGELGVWGPAAIALLLFALIGARRLPLIAAAAATILATHSLVAHKEYRFIYPAILLMTVLAGVGLAWLTQWAIAALRRKAVRDSLARGACAGLAAVYWSVLSLQVWTGPTLTGLRYRAHDTLEAMSAVAHGPATCGVGLYGMGGVDWVASGGYTYLHRAVPIYWPKDEAAFAASTAGFDTLISTRPPPGDRGFVTDRCFGDACVARRPGGCAALPMMSMPFPAPLAGMAP